MCDRSPVVDATPIDWKHTTWGDLQVCVSQSTYTYELGIANSITGNVNIILWIAIEDNGTIEIVTYPKDIYGAVSGGYTVRFSLQDGI